MATKQLKLAVACILVHLDKIDIRHRLKIQPKEIAKENEWNVEETFVAIKWWKKGNLKEPKTIEIEKEKTEIL